MTTLALIFTLGMPEHEAVFSLDSLEVTKGRMPRRAERLVREWAEMHIEELRENWQRARSGDDVLRIEGLQ